MECFLENLSDGTKHKVLSGLRFGNEHYSKDGSISKYHCGFMIDAEELTVEDLASENKTWLKINPNRLIQLNQKDILKLGNVNFQVLITADEKQQKAAKTLNIRGWNIETQSKPNWL